MNKQYLTKINDQLYRYNETFTVDGLGDMSIKFNVTFNGDNWCTDFMDVEGDTPTEVVERVFEVMAEESQHEMESRYEF
jgi:hypothetical protein